VKRFSAKVVWTTVALAVVSLLLVTIVPAGGVTGSAWLKPDGQFLSGNSKSNCAYPDDSLAALAKLEAATGTTFNCVLLYNSTNPTWADWTNVWWASPQRPDTDWLAWKRAVPGRRIIITQSMVPDNAPSNWRELGAAGQYDQYATQLATNLVREGLGDSVIRLGAEANNNADPHSDLGSDPSQYGDWARYWANIAQAMKAVPGAHFLFDWTVNQHVQPIPLDQWYPGDAAVDIVGIDAYDSGVTPSDLTPGQRWKKLSNESDGLNAVAAFAQAHGKPLSIPEWGLAPASQGGAGDDPTYVAGLASIISNHDVIYNSIFYNPQVSVVIPLTDTPRSLATYRQDVDPTQLLLTSGRGVVTAVSPTSARMVVAPLPALNQPIVGMAAAPEEGSYWLVAADGGVFSAGDARFYGSTGAIRLNKPIVGMAATPDGGGYWLVAADGGIFAFGDAQFHGSQVPGTAVSILVGPSGAGYWIVGSDGRARPFGDAWAVAPAPSVVVGASFP
jgi:Glycosyl hydrolase family 26